MGMLKLMDKKENVPVLNINKIIKKFWFNYSHIISYIPEYFYFHIMVIHQTIHFYFDYFYQ